MGLVVVCSHLGGVVCRPRWGSLRNVFATAGHLDCNSGLSFFSFYLRSKRGFLHSDVGAVVPTDVVGMASTVFIVGVAGRRLFVAVVALGTLVPPVRNMQCAAEVVVRIQAALVPLYCPYLTWPVVAKTFRRLPQRGLQTTPPRWLRTTTKPTMVDSWPESPAPRTAPQSTSTFW